MVTPTVPIAGDVAKKAIAGTLGALASALKSKLGTQIKAWTTQAKAQDLYKRSRFLRNVKTIWQIEREVDLYEFYHPSEVFIERDQRKVIGDLSDFDHDGCIVVQGTVGQGKSIFFRYLASQELLLGRSIPIFVELRRIKEGGELLQLALRALESLGLDVSEEVFAHLADSSKVTLFLDGFDEVPEDARSQLIENLELWTSRYENLRILVSTRPQSGIGASSRFRVYQLASLDSASVPAVVDRLCRDRGLADQINKGIAHHPVLTLLTTPLMVSLLVFRFKVEQSLPENAAAFFTNLFQLLLVRHDQSKPGFVRRRRSGLGDVILERIFCGTCFRARKAGRIECSQNELTSFIEQAIAATCDQGDAEAVLRDFVEITCLILREGTDCRFLHKSIVEYHAAEFVLQQPDAIAKSFYSSMHKHWPHWSVELEFLRTIDTYRFNRFFAIPDAMRALHIKREEDIARWTPSVEDLRCYRPDEIYVPIDGTFGMTGFTDMFMGQSYFFNVPWSHMFIRLSSIMPRILQRHGSGVLTGLTQWQMPAGMGPVIHLSEAVERVPQIREGMLSMLREDHRRLLDMCESVKRVEANRSLLDLD